MMGGLLSAPVNLPENYLRELHEETGCELIHILIEKIFFAIFSLPVPTAGI
jgi:hypothetical protein